MAVSTVALVRTSVSAICSASPSNAPPRRVALKKDMMERQPVLGPEPFRIGREIGRELLVARLCGSHVLGEEFHLLPHAAANDDVVAVEARRPAFAIENLVADVILDEALQFLLGRRAPPSASETVGEGGDA